MTRTVLTGGIVLDGRGGAPTSADVAIEGDRIVAIGPDLAPGDGADNLVDCAGAFIVPGVIDCHVHFMSDGDFDPLINLNTPFSTNFYLAAQRMARTLDIGVTTVRRGGCGADLDRSKVRRRNAAASSRASHADLDLDPVADGWSRRPVARAVAICPTCSALIPVDHMVWSTVPRRCVGRSASWFGLVPT
ncbi:MAG: hypothetical protein R2710_15150 [Acidimicrobiales bacterium]